MGVRYSDGNDMSTLVKESRGTVFPAGEVEACIREALANQAAD
jgi:hypothetical protein